MALNVTSTKQALVDLVNATNNKAFTLAAITVGAPSAFVSAGTNAKAKFSAIPGKGYRGSVDILYNRLTTDEAYGVTNYPFTLHGDVNAEADTVLQMVLAELSLKWNLPLTGAGEIGAYTYNKTGGAGDQIIGTLTIDLEPSYVLRGSLTVTVLNEKTPLPDVVLVTTLPGFKVEDVDLEDNG